MNKCTLCPSDMAVEVNPPTAEWKIYLCRDCTREAVRAWAVVAGPVWSACKREQVRERSIYPEGDPA